MTAKEFRNVRARLDWTQEDLAHWGGVSRRTLIRFENGQQPIPEIWARALNLFEGLPEEEKRKIRKEVWQSRYRL